MATGPQWPESSTLQQQLVETLLQNVCPRLDWSLENKKVLVVGCGPGDITAVQLLPRLPPDVSVIAGDDLSDDMLDQATARFANPRLRFIHLDIAAPDIKESPAWPLGPYGKIFVLFSLQWVRDQNLALDNVYKLLCPGGEVFLLVVCYSATRALYQALARSTLWEQYVEDFRHFMTPYQLSDEPEEALKSYLDEAGFCVESCEYRRALLISRNVEVVKDGVKSTNLPHEKLPEELRDLYMRECLEEMYSTGNLRLAFPPTDRIYHYKYTALIAHAIKL